jgi:hypothetical protein
VPRTVRMRLGSRVQVIGALLVRLRKRLGREACTRNGPCSDRRAFKECAASFIMLGHAGLLPQYFELLGQPA